MRTLTLPFQTRIAVATGQRTQDAPVCPCCSSPIKTWARRTEAGEVERLLVCTQRCGWETVTGKGMPQ